MAEAANTSSPGTTARCTAAAQTFRSSRFSPLLLAAVRPVIVTMGDPRLINSLSLPEDRARHSLDGEGRRGGHRFGTGTPARTQFPATGSGKAILDAFVEGFAMDTADFDQ